MLSFVRGAAFGNLGSLQPFVANDTNGGCGPRLCGNLKFCEVARMGFQI